MICAVLFLLLLKVISIRSDDFCSANITDLGNKTEDALLSAQILALGDVTYENCILYAQYINDQRAQNKSVPNVPKDDLTDDNVTFWLFTAKNPNCPQNLTLSNLNASYFDPTVNTIFFMPGAYDAAIGAIIICEAVLKSMKVNCIIVNWDSYSFFHATYSLNITARLVAGVTVKLIIRLEIKPSQIYCSGYSTGAQICGYVGKKIKNMARITAVDPAGPCYTYQNSSIKLTKADAVVVQSIHCSGGLYGPPPSYQVKADYYYEGGIFLQRCKNISSALDTGVCSHIYCKYIFYDSFINPTNSFGIKCPSYAAYTGQVCNNTSDRYVSGFFAKSSDTGLIFMDKTPLSPTYNNLKNQLPQRGWNDAF